MKKTMYSRGKYNKQQPKENKITFLSDDSMLLKLQQLSAIKQISMSQLLREAFDEYYMNSLISNE